MLQLFFTVAFSAVPLTLYIPPMRSLNHFVETMEGLLRESRVYTTRLYPRARHAWSRFLDIMLCNFRTKNTATCTSVCLKSDGKVWRLAILLTV
ncbi:F-box/WD repeat-containing protein [Populus alba x Populus x berolinensis]|nr:F-box/WD repeat-containing protein [Populus alba x Populus x berolinensis]